MSKRPGAGGFCKVCTHPKLLAIDDLLQRGGSMRTVGAKFQIPKSTIHLHVKERHGTVAAGRERALAEAQREASKVSKAAKDAARKGQHPREDADGKTTYERTLAGLQEDAHRIGNAAEADGDYKAAIAGVRALVDIADRMATVSGELKPAPAVGGYVLIFEGGVPRTVPEEEARGLLPPAIETTAIAGDGACPTCGCPIHPRLPAAAEGSSPAAGDEDAD